MLVPVPDPADFFTDLSKPLTKEQQAEVDRFEREDPRGLYYQASQEEEAAGKAYWDAVEAAYKEVSPTRESLAADNLRFAELVAEKIKVREVAEALAGGWQKLHVAQLEHLPPTEWLLEHYLVARNLHILSGRAGTFKTWLALTWACELASGGKNVLYMLNEAQDLLLPRVKAWAAYHEVDLPPLWCFAHHNFHIEANQHQIATMAGDGTDLIVVDTLRRATTGLSEDSSDDASLIVQACDNISRATGAAILLIDHTGHENQRRARGSSVKQDAVYMEMNVERISGSRTVTLHNDKLKMAPEWPDEQWQLLDGPAGSVMVPSGSVPVAKRAILDKKLLDPLLEAFGAEGFTKKQAKDVWDCSLREAGKRLTEALSTWSEIRAEGAGSTGIEFGIREEYTEALESIQGQE